MFLTSQTAVFLPQNRLPQHFSFQSCFVFFYEPPSCWFVFIRTHDGRRRPHDERSSLGVTKHRYVNSSTSHTANGWCATSKNTLNVRQAQFCKYPDHTTSGVLLPSVARDWELQGFNDKQKGTPIWAIFSYRYVDRSINKSTSRSSFIIFTPLLLSWNIRLEDDRPVHYLLHTILGLQNDA